MRFIVHRPELCRGESVLIHERNGFRKPPCVVVDHMGRQLQLDSNTSTQHLSSSGQNLFLISLCVDFEKYIQTRPRVEKIVKPSQYDLFCTYRDGIRITAYSSL